MRRLIRPAMFMVARIGLVLSVVVWVVGHRGDVHRFSIPIPTPSGTVIVWLENDCWNADYVYKSRFKSLRVLCDRWQRYGL